MERTGEASRVEEDRPGGATIAATAAPVPLPAGGPTATPAGSPCPAAEERVAAMRWSIWDGFFASLSDNLVVPFQVLFALFLGATKTQVGLVIALPLLVGSVLQFPLASLVDRGISRKKMYLYTNLVARLLWLPAAILPLLAGRGAAANLFIALVTIRSVFASAALPGWTSLMADVVPRGRRGAYFAWRNAVVNLAAFLAAVGAGSFIRSLPGGLGYQLAFLFAFLSGCVALVFFTRVPELPAPANQQSSSPGLGGDVTSLPTAGSKPSPIVGLVSRQEARKPSGTPWAGQIKAFLHDFAGDALGGFLWTSVLWTFAVNLAGPLLPVYFRETLLGDERIWGIGQGTFFVVTMLAQRYWGRLADQTGPRRTLLLSGVGAGLLPVFWIMARAPVHIVWAEVWSGFVWAGYNLAAFNLLLEVTPEEHRARAVGVYNLMVGVASATGPLMGARLAEHWGLVPIFAISAALRLLGLLSIGRRVKIDTDKPWRWRDLLPVFLERLMGRTGVRLRWALLPAAGAERARPSEGGLARSQVELGGPPRV